MKKTILLTMILALTLVLAACGQTTTQSNDANQAVVNGNGANADSEAAVPQGTMVPGSGQFEMPEQTLLILGTFKLEGTDMAIQADQAAELLPLWQVLKNLLDSDTAAQQEITALINQISGTMTDEQWQAIEDMNLTMEDLFTLNQDLGLNQGFPQAGDQQQSGGSGDFQSPEGFPEGAGPGGGFAGGPEGGPGGGGGFAQGLSPQELESLRATRQAEGGSGGFGMRGGGFLNTDLIDALIELLQSKL